jgi:hypothetical protein
VLADAGREDWILCQITSKPYGDTHAIPLEIGDVAHGSLRLTSYVRPGNCSRLMPPLWLGKSASCKQASSPPFAMP